jgi:ceramide glucosyltransferase
MGALAGLSPLGAVAWAWSAVVASVTLFAVARALAARWASAEHADPSAPRLPEAGAGSARVEPAQLLLVRPCAGAEATLRASLRSTGAVRTRHSLTVVLSAASVDDPAWPVVSELAAELRAHGLHAHAQLAPTDRANHKCGQLAAVIAAYPAAAVVINADADVELDGVDLDRLVDPILRGDVAATYAPPIEQGPSRTLGDRASQAVLDSSLHAFVMLGRLDPRGFVGKLCAVRRDALDRVGGFAALGDYLGEDIELARRLRSHGEATALVLPCARARVEGRTLGATVARYARWMSVVRAQRSMLLATYPLLFFPTLPLVLVAIVGGAWGAALLALSARALMAVGARLASGLPPTPWVALDVLLSDGVLAVAWLRALSQRELAWRGRRLELLADGRIREL